jgi:hypothetical protein
MKLYIKSKISLNDIVFCFILCLALLNGYFSGAGVGFAWASIFWNVGIIVMCAVVIMDYAINKKLNKNIMAFLTVSFIIFLTFITINYFGGIDRGYARKNLMTIVKVIVMESGILMFANNRNFNFYLAMKKSFYLFNFWGILNMIVLMVQINVKGFMMQSAWLSMNSYYEDLCAGLFGFNGTHRLGIYMTFLFVYNLYIAEFETPQKVTKKRLYIYNFALLGWHFVLSTKNDNMALYILTVLFFASYVFMDMHWRNYSVLVNIAKWSKYILAGVVAVVVVFSISSTREFILDGVITRISKLGTVTSSSRSSGSTERLSILLYSFENGFGYRMGKGIGYWPLGGDDGQNISGGFTHFGLSSMSSMVYLLGVWFYLFFVIWTSKIYQGLCKKNDKIWFIVIFLIMLFLTFYTSNLTSAPISVSLMLLFTVFGMMEESIREDKKL